MSKESNESDELKKYSKEWVDSLSLKPLDVEPLTTHTVTINPVYYKKFIENGWKKSLEIATGNKESAHRNEFVRAFIIALNNDDLPSDAIEHLANGMLNNFNQAIDVIGAGIGKGQVRKGRVGNTSFRVAMEVKQLTVDLPDAADISEEVFTAVSDKMFLDYATVVKYYSRELGDLRRVYIDGDYEYFVKIIYGL